MAKIQNRFDYGIDRSYTLGYEGMPLSPEGDFVPSPNTTNTKFVSSLSTEQLALAQEAYNTLHEPAVRESDRYGRRRSGTAPVENWINHYRRVGYDDFVAGFKTLLQMPKQEFESGLEPVHIPEDVRTDLDDYLKITSEGGIAIADWDEHDMLVHLMGTLLTTDDIGRLVQHAATAALKLPRKQKEDAGNLIDAITSNVKNLWLAASEDTSSSSDRIAVNLEALRGLTGLTYCNREDVLYFALDQANALRGLLDTPLFMNPAYLPQPGEQQTPVAA